MHRARTTAVYNSSKAFEPRVFKWGPRKWTEESASREWLGGPALPARVTCKLLSDVGEDWRERNGTVARTWRAPVGFPRSDSLNPITLQSPREPRGPRLQKELPRGLPLRLCLGSKMPVAFDPRRKIQAPKRSVCGWLQATATAGCLTGLKRPHLSRPQQRGRRHKLI